MTKNWQVPRRTFLRGLGAAVALPMLDAMVPARAFAAAGGAAKSSGPLRMAFMFVPNGAHMPDWTPRLEGSNFDLPSILQPLAPVKDDLLVLSGLTHDKGRANGDGPGDHARSAAVFLTGCQPMKTEGAIRASQSIDQRLASLVEKETRFGSLQLGTEEGRQSGQCDSGYSCAYSNNISWRDEKTPMPKEVNPRFVFERLFGNDMKQQVSENQQRRERYRKSILDFVLDDARQLSGRVGAGDRHKLDEYLTAVREIEQRIERAEADSRARAVRTLALSEADRPTGIPESYEEHIRLMGDMMVLAFQTDVTRVITFMLANEGSNKPYRFIGVNEGHHTLSHHQNDSEKQGKISKINHFHVEQLAYVLKKMKSTPEGGGSLLDNCMIVYGAGISDGNRHNNENLPIVIAGGGGGSILPGRHVRFPEETPMSNLFVSMLERMGSPVQRFGDSTGSLPFLNG